MQAMELISVAQQTGDVSTEVYNVAYHESGGRMPPPHMLGIEDQVPAPALTCTHACMQLHCQLFMLHTLLHAWMTAGQPVRERCAFTI